MTCTAGEARTTFFPAAADAKSLNLPVRCTHFLELPKKAADGSSTMKRCDVELTYEPIAD